MSGAFLPLAGKSYRKLNSPIQSSGMHRLQEFLFLKAMGVKHSVWKYLSFQEEP